MKLFSYDDVNCKYKCRADFFFIISVASKGKLSHFPARHRPPPPPRESRGTYNMLVPHHLNPLSREFVTIGNYTKNAPFLGKYSRDYATKIPPFPRNWEHAYGPLMHSSGGGGVFPVRVMVSYIGVRIS